MLKLPKRGGNLRVTGCLPFTCTNHLVHGVGKWFIKLKTGKFRPRIACTICTNQFRLDGREDLKLVSKMASKEWNTNFCLEYSIQKNRTTFSDVPVAPWNFPLGKPRVLFHLFSNQISQKIFVNGKQPLSVFSPIFLGHKSKIVATTIANMNKLSPTLNRPALQATICQ